MIIEYGHIYYQDILLNKINIKEIIKSIEILKSIKREDSLCVVLIDDKDFSLTNKEKNKIILFINELYQKLGQKPNKVYFEKDFSKLDDLIYLKLNKTSLIKENFKKDKKEVEFLVTDNKKIALKYKKENVCYYYCSYLAALWTLYQYNTYKKELVCILNKKYEDIEKNIEIILTNSEHNIKKTVIYFN